MFEASLFVYLHRYNFVSALDIQHQSVADGMAGEVDAILPVPGFSVVIMGMSKNIAEYVAGTEIHLAVCIERVADVQFRAV